LLEGIEGKRLYDAKGLARTRLPDPVAGKNLITLRELDRYVTDRVEVLSSEVTDTKNRRQTVKTYCTGNISLEQIPVAAYGSGGAFEKKGEN